MVCFTVDKTKTPFYIDSKDFEKISQYKWHAFDINGSIYIASNSNNSLVYLHRLILNAPHGSLVDHISGDTLDNRRINLRFCNKSTNAQNAKKCIRNTSGYKGVSWNKGHNKWKAYINKDHKQIFLGYYMKKKDAYDAYVKAGELLFGEFFRAK